MFVPSGDHAAAVAKTYGALGLREAGIKLIGPGDVTVDNKLQGMGASRGRHHHDAPLQRRSRQCGEQALRRGLEKGIRRRTRRPDFVSVGGYDGMAAIIHVVQQLKGRIDTDKALAALKGWKFDSPRGPIMIDPLTA